MFIRHPILKALLFVFLTAAASACGTDQPIDEQSEETEDVCEQAARHREACQGVYTTPPICDDAAAASAAQMLTVDCEEFEDAYPDQGKADGAFCDWFGAGCTPDEAIFIGPACTTHRDCARGESCIEKRCFAGVTSDEFQETLDIFTMTRESWGSSTYLLDDNHETRQLRLDLINNAQHSIHFVAFYIRDDTTTKEMVDALIAASRRGVEVRVMVDATSQYTSPAGYRSLQQMAQAGAEVIPFNPIIEWAGVRFSTSGLTANRRLHEKMLIVDGKEAIVGGRNVGDEYYLDGRWRDVDVYVDGPGVARIQRKYLFIWDTHSALEHQASCRNQAKFGFYCPLTDAKLVDDPSYFPELEASGTARTRAIYSAPFLQETSLGYFTTLALIRGAKESITIANAYFVPPRRLRKHLRAAAERGVKVRVLTNSKTSTDGWWMYYASLNYHKELIGSGIEIYQYDGTETMHSKAMVIDNELAVIGSFNLDPRSAIDNTEFLLLVHDSDTVDDLRRSIDDDITRSTLASDDIPWSELVKARAHRIVEPLL